MHVIAGHRRERSLRSVYHPPRCISHAIGTYRTTLAQRSSPALPPRGLDQAESIDPKAGHPCAAVPNYLNARLPSVTVGVR